MVDYVPSDEEIEYMSDIIDSRTGEAKSDRFGGYTFLAQSFNNMLFYLISEDIDMSLADTYKNR